jgi:hypothetical protein
VNSLVNNQKDHINQAFLLYSSSEIDQVNEEDQIKKYQVNEEDQVEENQVEENQVKKDQVKEDQVKENKVKEDKFM